MNPRLIATAVAGLAIGGLLGYKYAERKLLIEFEQRLDEETDAVRRMYKKDFDSPAEMVEKLYGEAAEAVQVYDPELKKSVPYHTIRKTTAQAENNEDKPEIIHKRVFQPDEDQGPIFIVSAEDNGAAVYETATLTYYAQDGVITFQNDEVMEDHEKFIGGTDVAALENFGGISGDENVVYVRNDIAMMDYEICRDPGSYVKAVLDQEYQPPAERPSQRMR